MRLVQGDTVRTGDAIDATDREPSARAILAAVRAANPDPGERVRIECAAPTPAHEYVGLIEPGMGLSLRAALAAAARTRGEYAPQDDRIDRLRAELAEMPTPTGGFAADRRAVAAAGADEDRLRERVASLRGRLRATEAAGDDTDAVADLRAMIVEAAGELARVETERIAATQRLAAAAERARATRTDRERRLRLQDRLENLRRDARANLAERVRPAFRRALAAVPPPHGGLAGDDSTAMAGSAGEPRTPTDATTVAVDGRELDTVSAALAVARFADLHAPVVLTARRFPDAVAAADWLDGPVILR